MTDELVERLETRNPIWQKNARSWREIEDVLFDHIKEHLTEYIERGDDEDPMDYERRLRFARFKGELSPVLHRIVGAVAARPPTRPPEIVSQYAPFIENVDGCQTHLDEFLEDRLFEALGFGASAFLIDRPVVGPEGYINELTSKNFSTSVDYRKVEDIDIVAVPYRINQVVDWSLDRCGEFHWVRLYEQRYNSADISVDSEPVEVYREFDRAGWRVYEVSDERPSQGRSSTKKTATLVDEGSHDLGIVPLVIVSLQKDQPMNFYSPMRYAYHHDIANFVSDADLQYTSWLHAHPTIVDYASTDEASRITIGPGASIRRNPEYKEDVKYLDFPKATTDQLRQNKQEAVEGLRRISGVDPLTGISDPAGAHASGRSRAISFSVSEERHLRRAAKSLAQAEQRLFEIAMRWVSPEVDIPPSQSLFLGKIAYPKVFTNAGTEGLIEQWLSTRNFINSESYDKQMQIKIIDSALGDISAEQRTLIMDEIEKNGIVSPMSMAGGEQGDSQMSPDDFLQAMREQETVEDVVKEEDK